MPPIHATTNELYRLYKEGMTLKEIAEKYGVSKQGIHRRFQIAGLDLRDRAHKNPERKLPPIDAEAFERMYVREGMRLYEIARRMNMSAGLLSRRIKADPRTSKMKRGSTACPELNTLKVGESFLVPRSEKKNDNYSRYYMLARRLGITLSISTINGDRLRITRVA